MNKWHRIAFKIKWDRQSPAKFYIDLMIIDLLIKTSVQEFKSSLECWTFHRSASPKDEDGHMLKFNVYTTQEIATQILDYIKSNEDYSHIKYLFEETEVVLKDAGAEIKSISDGDWPIEIQKSWPYYIMGCCEMFIKLTEEIGNNKAVSIDKNNPNYLEEFYREIEKEIATKWFKYGSHSFLHHLGAIFGYEFIFLRPRLIDENSKGIVL